MSKIDQALWAGCLCLLISGCSYHQSIHKNSLISAQGGHCTRPSDPLNQVLAREILIGSWQGAKRQQLTNEDYQWLTHHFSDGTYRSIFRTSATANNLESPPPETNNPPEQIEVGYWGVSGMVRYTIFRGWESPNGVIAAPPDEPSYYDAFLLQYLDENHMTYCNLETGESFTAVRVKSGSEFTQQN